VYKKILVPLDGSKLAEGALRHVEQLAWEMKSSLVLLRVVRPPRSVEHPWAEEMMALNREREAVFKKEAETYLAGRKGELRNKKIKASTYVIVSQDVAATILDFAAQQPVDLIAMSRYGRSGPSRWVFGSVAEKVLQHAPCPVLLVPSQQEG
jgi:nucleotide-binding universal stress UspA family protein